MTATEFIIMLDHLGHSVVIVQHGAGLAKGLFVDEILKANHLEAFGLDVGLENFRVNPAVSSVQWLARYVCGERSG
jgi:hypothetical protein